MPELRLRDVDLHYAQSGAGTDILWLAAGDNPGDPHRVAMTSISRVAPKSSIRTSRIGLPL